jgi:hypothetical protein
MTQNIPDISFGLSPVEKHDLEQMIDEFQKERRASMPTTDPVALQKQMDAINGRMAHLSTMLLTLDQRIKPLYEIVRLTFEKSDILNQRINTLIESIRSGDPL